MTTLRSLKFSARRSAEFRGHRLGNFKSYSKTTAMAICQNPGCYCSVTVLTKPWPNEINIGGQAVAIHCKG